VLEVCLLACGLPTSDIDRVVEGGVKGDEKVSRVVTRFRKPVQQFCVSKLLHFCALHKLCKF